MIAADTSSMIAYFAGDEGADVALVQRAVRGDDLVLPPVVAAELFSDPRLPKTIASALVRIPLLALNATYWFRAGELRARAARSGRKARLAGALIAQACLDHDVELIARDRDFRIYRQIAALRVVP